MVNSERERERESFVLSLAIVFEFFYFNDRLAKWNLLNCAKSLAIRVIKLTKGNGTIKRGL